MARRRFQKGSLRLRGDSWEFRWYEEVIKNGQVCRVYHSEKIGTKKDYPTKKLALRSPIIQERLAVVNSPVFRARPTATFAQFAERWETKVLPQFKGSTQVNCCSHLRRHLLPFLGRFQMKDIGPELVQGMVSQIGAGARTVRNVYITLRMMWRSARVWGYAVHDACEGVVLPKAQSREQQRFFTLEEQRKIIAAADEPYRTFYWLLAETGMRAGEVCGLQMNDLDLERGLIFVRRNAWQGRLQSPKTEGSVRRFDLSPDLVEHLLRYLMDCWPNPQRLLFATSRGTPWDHSRVRKRKFYPLLDRLGIRRAGFHAFRHGSETLMDRLGVPLGVRMGRLGHTDVRTTLLRYTHVDGEDSRRVAAQLGRILNPNEPMPEIGPKVIAGNKSLVH